MYGILSDIKSLLRIGAVSIDNWVFKLHYKLSTIILVIFSILVNSRQFFGDPIDCTQGNSELANYIDTFCWFNSYSLVNDEGHVYLQVAKTIGDRSLSGNSNPASSSGYRKISQSYYQWIGVVLLLQAASFYFPYFLWKYAFEGGRVRELVNGLQNHIQEEEEILKGQKKVVEYLQRYKGHHRSYAFQFFLCEILNFINVIAQIFLTDWFLGHAFMNYGVKWLVYDVNDDKQAVYHPSHRYFPKETVCDVEYGGAGGQRNNFYAARCVLPIQVFNERIFLFNWFYFIILGAISGAMLVYRIFVLLSPRLRSVQLQRRAWATDENVLRIVCDDLDLGDWFIVYQIMKNVDPFVLARLMKGIYDSKCSNNGYGKMPSTISSQRLLSAYSSSYDIGEKVQKLYFKN